MALESRAMQGTWAAWTSLVLGAWSITVPYLGPLLGLRLDVAASVEVVDHVVPGAVALLAAIVCVRLLRRDAADDVAFLASAGFVALAGLWMTATHLPLLVQARVGFVPWPAALWHSSGGLALLVLGVALFLLGWRAGQVAESGRG